MKKLQNLKLIHYILLAALLLIGTRAYYHWSADKESMAAVLVTPKVEPLKASIKPEALKAANKPEKKRFSYKVAFGDTLSKIWMRISGKDRGNEVASALKDAGQKPNTFLQPGDDLRVKVDEYKQIKQLSKRLEDGRRLIIKNEDGKFTSEIIEPKIITSQRTITRVIQHSFAKTATSAGLDYEMIDEMVDAFSGRIEFRSDIHPGDSFSVIYEERKLARGRTLPSKSFIAASFMNKGKQLMAIRVQDPDGNVNYFDSDGNALGDYFLRYPVQFTRISSVFSTSRFHPVLKIRRPHNGVDFAAPVGTPVRTVADGTIVHAAYDRANGNMIKIKHSDRFTTAYLHLNKITAGIKKGVKVKRGQMIGTVGKTGLATGAHLHFAYYDYGKYVDPLKIKLPSSVSVTAKPGKDLLAKYREALLDEHKKIDYSALNSQYHQ
jgi:murein DD-endopeptidase MepM/ murein hydrolase activator NlpD